MTKLTLIHGLCSLSGPAFVAFGTLCMQEAKDVDSAMRFGDLCFELNDRFHCTEYIPRAHAGFYGCIHHWKRPLRDSLSPLLVGHRVGMITGDIEYACLNGNMYCFNSFDAGVPLDGIVRAWTGFRRIMTANRQKALYRMSMPCLHTMQFLLEESLDTRKLDKLVQKLVAMRLMASANYIRLYQMLTAYLLNDYELAHLLARHTAQYVSTMPPRAETPTMLFFSGMVALAMLSRQRHVRWNRQRAHAVIQEFITMAKWCPANFLAQQLLLQAEWAAVSHEDAKALGLYLSAIDQAHTSGFLHVEALANERCARFCVQQLDKPSGLKYFRRAMVVYDKWQAKRKVHQLQKELERLFEESATELSATSQ
jgi:hypothetical protein